MTANVQDLTVPELRAKLSTLSVAQLYSLAWEVAERLVELEVARLKRAAGSNEPMERLWRDQTEGEGASVALAGSYVFNSPDDNYTAW